MVFSSPVFLFFFLPIVLAGCLLPTLRLRNLWLLTFSVIFYAWGEMNFVGLMLGSTIVNYVLGLWIERATEGKRRRMALAVAITFNIGLLAVFKYTNFAVDNINTALGWLGSRPLQVKDLHLPIGISFFTFHAISYAMDIYDRKWTSAKNPTDVALYIFFFPQLIAGPILRWNAIAPQIAGRRQNWGRFAEGVQRFAQGLGKKVLIANMLGGPADLAFGAVAQGMWLPLGTAWLGILCYALQIYFDFSGYSDMAIGMGKMFGFEFMENFNYPYIAQSIRDFWKRWHISLSSWFRDYLYIPLGGNRCSKERNQMNLFLVFLLCGLWHGASWTFVVWGIYHGIFIVLEHGPMGRRIAAMPRFARHLYAGSVILVGWVFFRAECFTDAIAYLRSLADIHSGSMAGLAMATVWTRQTMVALGAALLLATPCWNEAQKWVKGKLERRPGAWSEAVLWMGAGMQVVIVAGLLIVSAAWLAGETYNPFIYFRF